jgi:hypothetical protein
MKRDRETIEERADAADDRDDTGELVGRGVGGLGGAVVGGAAGLVAGPVGMIIGGIAGAVGGWWAGDRAARIVAEMTEENEARYREHYGFVVRNEDWEYSYDEMRPYIREAYMRARTPEADERARDQVFRARP